MLKKYLPAIIFVSLVAVLLTVDMLTKYFTDGTAASVHNTGISFSLFEDSGIWLIVITSVLSVASLAAWWFMGRKKILESIAFAFFVTGAVGNLYDRIAYGYVRDFIRLNFWPAFPVFNIADICLTVGTIALVVVVIWKSFSKTDISK